MLRQTSLLEYKPKLDITLAGATIPATDVRKALKESKFTSERILTKTEEIKWRNTRLKEHIAERNSKCFW